LEKIDIKNPMQIRMGVSTRYCTVGDFGSPQRLEYTAFGSAMNPAARLQVLAPAGKILISAATHALEEDNIECAKHQMITPKGICPTGRHLSFEKPHAQSPRHRQGEISKIRILSQSIFLTLPTSEPPLKN